jgi:hypothetical protein
MADRKSPIAGSANPTRRNAIIVIAESLNAIFTFFFTHRNRRLVDPERGTTNSSDPRTAKLEEDSCLTKKLRGAPSPEGKHADTKHHLDRIPASKTPSAGSEPTPTLCTGLDPWISQPPAAGAAGGGGEIHGSEASEVGKTRRFTKSPLSTVDGREGNVQVWPTQSSLVSPVSTLKKG